MEQIITSIESLSVLDLVALKKSLEDRWGVTPVVMNPFTPTDPGVTLESPVEEQTEFAVRLDSFGATKINVIKAVRELTSLGLKEAKSLVESAPVSVRDGLPRDEAESAAVKLREAGAAVTLI